VRRTLDHERAKLLDPDSRFDAKYDDGICCKLWPGIGYRVLVDLWPVFKPVVDSLGPGETITDVHQRLTITRLEESEDE